LNSRIVSGVHLTASDDALAATVDRWVKKLEGGDSLDEGKTVVVDGWPFQVRKSEDALHLCALDLGARSDEPSRWTREVDPVARVVASQLEVFDVHGIDASLFSPPSHIFTIAVCPSYRREGPYMLARTPPAWPSASSWVMQCGRTGCIHSLRADRRHVPDDEWQEISIVELVVTRPSVARYLALPVGFVASNGWSGPRVAKRHALREEVPLDTNVAAFDLPHDYAIDCERRTPVEVRALDLDLPSTHRLLLLSDARDVLCDRFNIDGESAKATLARYRTPEMQIARIQAAVPELDIAAIAAVVEILRASTASKVRAYQDAGRKLRELTGRPFLELQKLAEKIDEERERVEWASR
jgi:hypothetical protein